MEYQIMVDGIEVQSNEQVNEREARTYIGYTRRNNPKREISPIELSFDGEEVGLGYCLQPGGFEKVGRITGYLVGVVDCFNDGKYTEEHDRVKHVWTVECYFFSV